jgi:hypothetical protein
MDVIGRLNAVRDAAALLCHAPTMGPELSVCQHGGWISALHRRAPRPRPRAAAPHSFR